MCCVHRDLYTDNRLYTINLTVQYCTVEPVLEDGPIGHENVVSQDRWSLVTDSITLKNRTYCQEYLVFRSMWSLMTMVKFHCANINGTINIHHFI